MAEDRRRAWWTPVALALLCGHCAAGALVAGASMFGLVALPAVGGVPLAWVAPPALMLGGFGLWLWSGARASRADACAVPVTKGDDA